MRRPNFFVVGAPKSGTTAMYTYLKAHPAIFMSAQKELHFFGSDLHRINHTPFTMKQYLSFFAAARDQKRVGEASTTYLQSRLAPAEIKGFAPDARIMIMLRSPVDVMYAFHSEHLYGGFEEIGDFTAALEAEPRRRAGLDWPRRPGVLETLFYRDVVAYAEQVERYFNVFGRHNVHVLLYEDFERDAPAAYRDTLHFLGVDPDFQPELAAVNVNKRVRSRRLQRFLLRPPALVSRLARAVARRSTLDKLTLLIGRVNTAVEPRPPLDSAVRRRLQAELADNVARLGGLLGRDLSHWTAPSEASIGAAETVRIGGSRSEIFSS